MRDALLGLTHVKEAAVDYDQGLAYVLPQGSFDSGEAIAVLGEGGKYSAKIE